MILRLHNGQQAMNAPGYRLSSNQLHFPGICVTFCTHSKHLFTGGRKISRKGIHTSVTALTAQLLCHITATSMHTMFWQVLAAYPYSCGRGLLAYPGKGLMFLSVHGPKKKPSRQNKTFGHTWEKQRPSSPPKKILHPYPIYIPSPHHLRKAKVSRQPSATTISPIHYINRLNAV